ncbi:MAG TPA: octaprenyl diphosphate synthase [Gammaproteobacteria bacterium]|nr:octaprenyl diphosphate synthase [Gammaproteobacteria bacterium]
MRQNRNMSLAKTNPDLPSLEALRALVGDDWNDVNRTIVRRLGSDVALVNQVAHHIIHNGGKRLRPLAVLLAARACGAGSSQDHITAAAIIEFIHTATLLHDDVVDSSGLRRGRETANAVFGNQASVLVGDFLYSRSFQMMVELEEIRILDVLANATNTIAEGEVLQLMNCNNPDISEADYMEVIYRKTAKLFEAGTRIGAILAKQDDAVEQALAAYGRHLGQAFQLVDDALDYDAKVEELGKNIGDDLAEGKPTLPLIYAMAHGSAAERHMIREAVETGGTRNLTSIQLAIETSGGLRYTAERARAEVELAIGALAPLPQSKFRDGLIDLAQFAVQRRY